MVSQRGAEPVTLQGGAVPLCPRPLPPLPPPTLHSGSRAKLACPSSPDRPGLSFLSDATQTAYLAGGPCLCCEVQLTMVFVGWAPRHTGSHTCRFISGTSPQSKSTGQTTLTVMTQPGYKVSDGAPLTALSRRAPVCNQIDFRAPFHSAALSTQF